MSFETLELQRPENLFNINFNPFKPVIHSYFGKPRPDTIKHGKLSIQQYLKITGLPQDETNKITFAPSKDSERVGCWPEAQVPSFP